MLELYLSAALLVDLLFSTPQAAASGPRRSPEALSLSPCSPLQLKVWCHGLSRTIMAFTFGTASPQLRCLLF
jgi:hypothetical protein